MCQKDESRASPPNGPPTGAPFPGWVGSGHFRGPWGPDAAAAAEESASSASDGPFNGRPPPFPANATGWPGAGLSCWGRFSPDDTTSHTPGSPPYGGATPLSGPHPFWWAQNAGGMKNDGHPHFHRHHHFHPHCPLTRWAFSVNPDDTRGNHNFNEPPWM